jgi:5'-nucleotidase
VATRKLHILHTNDIHSHFGKMALISGGMKHLAQACRNAGDEVVLVDLGDHMDRMSFITEGTQGQANIEIMNATGYSLVSLGNNEGLTFTKERLAELYAHAQFQVLCANLKDVTTDLPPSYIKPYLIEQIGALRVGWVSVTAPFSKFYQLLGWKVSDPIQVVETTIAKIRTQVDVIIVLSHVGFRLDQKMAEQIPTIDVIIGSHTHHLIEFGKKIGETFIIQAGKFGNYIGRTTIEFDENAKQVVNVSGQCYPVEGFTKDASITALINKNEQTAKEILEPPLFFLNREFPVHWTEESMLGNLLAEGVRKWVNADLSMVNAGLLLDSIPAGPVSAKYLLSICPHPINPCKVWLTGSQIKEILEQSLMEKKIFLQVQGFGFRGKMLGWMCVDGLTIRYDLAREEGQRILHVLVNGQPLAGEHTYSVGTVDMFTFGWIYPLFSQSEVIDYYLPEFIRDVLHKELKREDAMHSSSVKRWVLIDEKEGD